MPSSRISSVVLMPVEAHRLQLGGQAVGVPAEAALDALAAHRLVARDQVLDVAGEQVAVVRQAVGERRAVVEDELVRAVLAGVALVDAGLEGAVLLPEREHPLLDLREPRARGHAAGVVLRVGHRRHLLWCRSCRHHRDDLLGDRGTTLLARSPTLGGPLVHGCDGPTRPVLLSPPMELARRSSGGSPLMTARTPVRQGYGAGSGARQSVPRSAWRAWWRWERFHRPADEPQAESR